MRNNYLSEELGKRKPIPLLNHLNLESKDALNFNSLSKCFLRINLPKNINYTPAIRTHYC